MKLDTKRLILREWEETDLDDLLEGLNNLNVSRWLAFVPYPYSRQDGEKWIANCIKNSSLTEPRTRYDFAIELRSEHKVIGGVTLNKISEIHGTAGGGLWISEPYQGLGYGTEAFGERIRFAFEDLKLRRLENGFFEGNQSSLKLQEKFGYQVEGIRRKAFRCMADGKLKNEYITGLLKEEWQRY